VKQGLRRKARLVAGGHLVDATEYDIYSWTVKSKTVNLLHVITHKQKLKQLCGDVGNAYTNAFTEEKSCAIAGPEFGDKEGCVAIIKKALYGLKTSLEQWYAHFADTPRSLKFKRTRFS
jgi:Reverse transcriptase (RNA-dependent DNA polymerase)